MKTTARKPEKNGVLRLNVGGIRRLPPLRVDHTPMKENRAHSDVLGKKDPETRIKLLRLHTLEVLPPEME